MAAAGFRDSSRADPLDERGMRNPTGLLVLALLGSCSAPPTQPAPTSAAAPAPAPMVETRPSSLPWFEGGTLHRATLREWNAATSANRLATAADFAATILKARKLSTDQLRPKAVELVEAIRPSAEDPSLGALKVAEVAAASGALLGWK